MSIRFDTSTDQLYVQGSLHNQTVFSWGKWFKLPASIGTPMNLLTMADGVLDATAFNAAGIIAGPAFEVADDNSSASGGTPAVSTGYYVLLSRTGTTLRMRVYDDSTSTTPLVDINTSNSTHSTARDDLISSRAFTGEVNADTVICEKFYGGAEWTDSEARLESQKITMQKAGGSPSWVWRNEDIDADTNGLNELAGGGPNTTNSGAVTDAWRPAQLEPLTTTLEQEGYRWVNDDGNEAGSTFHAAQDTTINDVPLDTNIRLRAIVNVTAGDPAAGGYRLEFRKAGETVWAPVSS